MTRRNAEEARERDARIAEIPWVKRYTGKDKKCEGIKWGNVALKHLYTFGDKPAEGIPDKARCKLRAKWHFTALRARKHEGFSATTGDYCIHHLFSIIYSYQREYERYVKWSKEKETSNG
jgi:hypothetical protein